MTKRRTQPRGRARAQPRGTRSSNQGGQLTLRNANVEWADRMVMPRQVSSKVYATVKTVLNNAFATSQVGASTFASFAFTLANNVPEVSSLAVLFDQYRLCRVELDILPSASENLALATTLGSGTYATAIDYDDANTPSSVQQILNYDNALMHRSFERSTRTFKPRLAVAAYSGAFSSFANVADSWIDIASTGVQYYGLKFAATISATTMVFDAVVRTHWEFRASR
jgi:hypothetical protein